MESKGYKLLDYEKRVKLSQSYPAMSNNLEVIVLVSLCKEVSGTFIYSTAPLLHVFFPSLYCGAWPIKCRQGSKMNKSNC
jgi:hypothetical protein